MPRLPRGVDNRARGAASERFVYELVYGVWLAGPTSVAAARQQRSLQGQSRDGLQGGNVVGADAAANDDPAHGAAGAERCGGRLEEVVTLSDDARRRRVARQRQLQARRHGRDTGAALADQETALGDDKNQIAVQLLADIQQRLMHQRGVA